MSEIQIKKINQILQEYVGQEWVISNLEVVPFLPKGENYCTNVSNVSATLRLHLGKETKAIRAIAKTAVSTGLFEMVFLNIYQREVYFYTKIIPSLKEFTLRHCNEDIGDMFPEFYGYSDPPEKATNDSVILIKDLTTKGYEVMDRFIGYDYDQIKFVLKSLAFFHGASLAMKVKEPNTFDSNIKTFCHIDVFPQSIFEKWCVTLPDLEQNKENSTKLLLQILEDYHIPEQYIQKMADFLGKEPLIFAGRKLHTVPDEEPFNTLIHNDLWINNIMFIMMNGGISEMRLIDFQMYRYNHPVKDLMHVLWTSVKYDVLKEHLDDLIDFYYQNLIANLMKMDCDISEFEKKQFFKDMKISMGALFGHVIFMIIFVVFGKRKSESENFEPPSMKRGKNDIPEEAKKKFCFLVEQMFKRGWCTGIDYIDR